jgi:hypothetical protein
LTSAIGNIISTKQEARSGEQQPRIKELGTGLLTPCSAFLAPCSIRKPEVAIFGQRLAIIVEDEGVPAAVVGVFNIAFIELLVVGVPCGSELFCFFLWLDVCFSAFRFFTACA